MLLINKTLLRLAKGLWGWIAAITAVRLFSLAAVTHFAASISALLGGMVYASVSPAQAGSAILSALGIAGLILLFDLLKGELEYRCTAGARVLLRDQIFSKVVALDAGRIEALGPVSAITASVDAVESMQIYYSQYLPGLLYSLTAPVYLYFRLRSVNHTAALILGLGAILLLPLNNAFRSKIEEKRRDYWGSMEDLTAYYLESLRGIQTIKLFGREKDRTEVLTKKSYAFREWILEFMSINFTSFLATEGVINLSIVCAVFACASLLMKNALSLENALLFTMLGFTFFNSFRELLQTTHNAITAVAAADKVEQVLDIDTSRPYDADAPADPKNFRGLRMEGVSCAYEGRGTALKNVSMEFAKGRVTAIAGLSGCGKSTSAAILMKFFDPPVRPRLHRRKRLCEPYPCPAAGKGHPGAPVRLRVFRHDPGQSPCRRPKSDRGGDVPRARGSEPGGMGEKAAGRPSNGRGRCGEQTVRRTEAEDRYRKSAAEESGLHHLRRGCVQRGRRERTGDLEMHRAARPLPHPHHHFPQAVHHTHGRPDLRAGARRSFPGRDPRGTHGP